MRITMWKEKETKGAVRYTEPDEVENNPMYLVGTLYLRKAGMVSAGLTSGEGSAVEYPDSIVVTVE